jgi:aminopeptidase N
LAASRKHVLSGIVYEIDFRVPDTITKHISGTLKLSFNLQSTASDLILDFNVPGDKLLSVTGAKGPMDYSFKKGHIIIPSGTLTKGQNSLLIAFTAGETSLNRNRDYLYSLFVPDRASSAFPCFDQPDLKAVFSLSLSLPEGWTAVATGKKRTIAADGENRCTFEPTPLLPTYLFAFAAGVFDTLSAHRDGRDICIYHMEKDAEKLQNNALIIFEQAFDALAWLEDYTRIPYPFPKYDMVCIPSFQYGGMEHPGAILFRSDRLFLEQSATINQKLGRANLIAHETAHMWFGDLVTMRWLPASWQIKWSTLNSPGSITA